MSDYGFTDTSSTRKLEKINSTVWDINSRDAWPFLEQTIVLTFDGVNSTPLNMPTDFQSVMDIVDLSTGGKMQPLRLQEADTAMALLMSQVGSPYYYYFIGETLHFSQIPPSTTSLQMRYYRKQVALLQTDIASAILLPAEHHEAILYGSLFKLYDLEDDTDLSLRFQQLYENKIQNMRQAIWMRQYDRPDHIQITDRYDYDFDFYN